MPRAAAAVCATLLVTACGPAAAPTGVATNPASQSPAGRTPVASPTPAVSGVRTVLSPLGLNIHAQPALSAAVVGTPAQGATLAVLDHTDQNGGWYRVQGATVSGWITADPALSASGQFQQYQSSDFGFGALYPQDWTFDATTSTVTFRPQSGPQTITVRDGATVAAFARGAPGYFQSSVQAVVVCGVTGDLDEYNRVGGAATASPTGGSTLPLLAQIRLQLDASHALALDFNYGAASDLDVFSAFYNSLTFPFPQCMQTPAATSTP